MVKDYYRMQKFNVMEIANSKKEQTDFTGSEGRVAEKGSVAQSFNYQADFAHSGIIQSGGNKEFSLFTIRRTVQTQASYSPAEMKNSVF